MKFSRILLIPALAATLFISACKEDLPGTGTLSVELEHLFDTKALELNTATPYVSGSAEEITFTTFKYYISNVRLQKADGTEWAEPESYRLIDLANAASTLMTFDSVPEGEYTGITFTIGVDSLRNVSGAQTGALSPSNEMFWSWNSGYIFLKAEGNSPQASGGKFEFHIGGFRNANNTNALQEVEISFGGESLKTGSKEEPELHLSVNAKEFFDGHHTALKLAELSVVHMPGADAIEIAENYHAMFEFEHIHQ
ncbi:MAG: hypothetical protein EAZ89_17390 [Bacteroidetes bacterium]|nr:MAG: hypothetical protein EAZ89_17390 [Bacteroidota bacterium]